MLSSDIDVIRMIVVSSGLPASRHLEFSMLPTLFLIPLAHADWKVNVTVKVATTKTSGEAWDTAGGAPDIAICVVTPSNTHCDVSKYGTCQDKFHCTLTGVIVPNGPFTVWAYDVDLTANDTIGGATCKGKGDDWTQRSCDVASPLLSMTISR